MGLVNEVTIAMVLDGMDLTDAQWVILEPFFGQSAVAMDAGGPGAIRAPC